MKKYKNFITTGCSFSSGVFEPDKSDIVSSWKQKAFSWPHHCLTELGPENTNFINFAIPGGGNNAAINNLIYYFELNQEIGDVLVGINLTGLARRDTICSVNQTDKNNDLSNKHITEKLNIGWINHKQYKIQDLQEIIIYNCLTIIQGITYIESKNIDYFFMFMTDSDYTYSPQWFKDFLNTRQKNWVKFGKHTGMWELVKDEKLTTDDGHPNKDGHRLIALYVLEHLKIDETTA